MNKSLHNIVIVIHDGFGHYANNDDWCTDDSYGMKKQFNSIKFAEDNFINFTNAISPAASTIMSIESILSGVYAAKAHKLHWREWPSWDRINYASISDVLEEKGYSVNGFSYLLNSENWMPAIRCYKPELYANYPSEKKDTHSYEAVISAFRHYFQTDFNPGQKQCLIVHSVYIYKFWDEMNEILIRNGLNSDNTIMAVTADHYFPESFGRFLSYELQNGRSLLHHTDLTECNTRVPLYLRYPGSKHTKISDLVSGYDLAPTIADLIGIIEQWPNKLDGKSLLKIDSKESRITRTDNVYPFQIGEIQGRISSIRDGVYKLVVKPDPPSSYVSYRLTVGWNIAICKMEFYNLNEDPLEKKNLLDNINLTVSEQDAFNRLNKYYQDSTEDILNYHLDAILCIDNKKLMQYFMGKKVLIIQNTHDEIYLFISKFIKKLQCEKITYACESKLNKYLDDYDSILPIEHFNNSILEQKKIISEYDLVIVPAHHRFSFYGNIYNKNCYVDNYKSISEISHNTDSSKFYALGLDLSLEKFPFRKNIILENFRLYYALLKFLFNKIRNIRVVLSAIANKDYSEKIITLKQ